MYTYEMDEALLPKVWLYWRNSQNQRISLDCERGKRSTEKPAWMGTSAYIPQYSADNKHISFSIGSKIVYPYMKYHADNAVLELAVVTMSNSRKEVARKWEYAGERYFLSKDKTVRNSNGDIQTSDFVVMESITYRSFRDFLRYMIRNHSGKIQLQEFIKLLGTNSYACGNGRTTIVNYIWNIFDWYERKQPTKSSGKSQQLIDSLTATELEDHVFEKIKCNSDRIWQNYFYHAVYFERVNDDWCVLRHYQLDDETYQETNRTYLDANDKVVFTVKTTDGWVPCRQHRDTWGSIKFINENDAVANCKRIKYIMEAIAEDDKQKMNIEALITALRFPEIEQMIKLGYTDKAMRAAKANYTKAELKHMFGDYYNEKEKNLTKKVGMTKQQLDYVMNWRCDSGLHYSYNSHNPLKRMREMFGDDLSHVDKASFEKHYDGCTYISNYFGTFRGSDYYTDRCGVTDKGKFFKNLIRLGAKEATVYQLARDTMNQYSSLSEANKPEINWYFDSVSDITRAHDAITELRNAEIAERNAYYAMQKAERDKKDQEKMAKLDEKRKEWEYEDDQFIIRLPKTIAEIVTEGSKQRICIGGYTTSHSNGNTNLFFLRKKSDPDTPFYAIEMSNSKHIVQIHGYANCWLGCNPEAIPTIVRWMRKNDIKCSEQILTCTAKGYTRTATYIAMPKVD